MKNMGEEEREGRGVGGGDKVGSVNCVNPRLAAAFGAGPLPSAAAGAAMHPAARRSYPVPFRTHTGRHLPPGIVMMGAVPGSTEYSVGNQLLLPLPILAELVLLS